MRELSSMMTLEKYPLLESTESLSSRDFVKDVIRYVSKGIPIFIYSVNKSQIPGIYWETGERGIHRGLDFLQDFLIEELFNDWLDYVRENQES